MDIKELVALHEQEKYHNKLAWKLSSMISEVLGSLPLAEVKQYYTEIYPEDGEKAQERFEKHCYFRERKKEREREKAENPLGLRRCVVYGLYKEDELVYIGSSVNPTSRKADHKRKKDFDTFRILYRGFEPEMRELEAQLIKEERPKLNQTHT